ncbi:methyltransferase domain-containing protein [Bacteroidota bacterium]
MKLNIGCGRNILEGYENLDIVDYGGNTICDLNSFPYPFEENSFDEILASHILEHLDNFHNCITELYRIARPGAIIKVYAPFFLNTKFFGDPDHKIPFSIRTFDNYEFIGGRKLKFYEKWKLHHRTNYEGGAKFQILSKKFNFSNFTILKWLNFFINIEPVLFERFFSGILSPEEVIFILKVIKNK